MAKEVGSKKASSKSKQHEKVKSQITESLNESQKKFNEEYQNRMLAQQNLSDGAVEPVSDTAQSTLEPIQSMPLENTVEKTVNKEEEKMAKELKFDDDNQKFGENAKDETQKPETGAIPEVNSDAAPNAEVAAENNTVMDDTLPQIEDDGAVIEEKAKEDSAKTEKEKVTTGRYDGNLEDLAEKHITNFSNLKERAASVAYLLQNNVMLKQMITAGNFGRGFVMVTQNIAGTGQESDKVSHFRIENLKPGRAKTVVVTMPRVLRDILVSTASSSKLSQKLSEVTKDGTLTEEQSKDTVDVVMRYDDLMSRVATMFEGKIAEFGGVGGELDDNINVKYGMKNDPTTQTQDWASTDVSDKLVKEPLHGKPHVMYTMAQPSGALMSKAVKGEALGDKDRKAIKRYREGKTPLKRNRGAYSALYTHNNFTSLIQYVQVTPFSGNLSSEDAKKLSAKAVFKFKERSASSPRMESYDSEMVNGDIVRVFDPSIKAEDRIKLMQVASGYVKTKADGTPYTKKVAKVDESGKEVKDAKGNRVYENVPYKAVDKKLADRTVRDYYTGEPLPNDKVAKAGFVTYGEPGMTKGTATKPAHATAPRVNRKRISFEKCEATPDASKGLVGVFGIDDASVSRFVKLVGEDVAKEAFINATSRATSTAAGGAAASEYGDGILAAMLNDINV